MKNIDAKHDQSIQDFARNISKLRTEIAQIMTNARLVNENALRKLEQGIKDLENQYKMKRPERKAVVISASLELFHKIDAERLVLLRKIDPIGPFPEPPRKYSYLKLHMIEDLMKTAGFET